MQSLPQGIQQFNLCSRQALPTSMYPWSTKDISFPEFNMDYSTQFQGNLFYEQQKRIKFLEDELKRHKSQIEDLSSKLIIFEQEKKQRNKRKRFKVATGLQKNMRDFLKLLRNMGVKTSRRFQTLLEPEVLLKSELMLKSISFVSNEKKPETETRVQMAVKPNQKLARKSDLMQKPKVRKIESVTMAFPAAMKKALKKVQPHQNPYPNPMRKLTQNLS